MKRPLKTTAGFGGCKYLLITSACSATNNEKCAQLALEKEIPEKLINLIKLKKEKIDFNGKKRKYGKFIAVTNTLLGYLYATDLKCQVIDRFMNLRLDIILLELLEDYVDGHDCDAKLYIILILEILFQHGRLTKQMIDSFGYYTFNFMNGSRPGDYQYNYPETLVAICKCISHILAYHPQWRFYHGFVPSHTREAIIIGACSYIKKYPQPRHIVKSVKKQKKKNFISECWDLEIQENMDVFLSTFVTLRNLNMRVKIKDVVSMPHLCQNLTCFLFCYEKLMSKPISLLCVEKIVSSFRITSKDFQE